MDISGLKYLLDELLKPWELNYTYFIPTPPAINTTLSMVARSIPSGGQKKLPPTLIINSEWSIFEACCHSHAAGGFPGEY